MAVRTPALFRARPGARSAASAPGRGAELVPDPAPARRPGSAGEHLLQCTYGTQAKADRFYADQLRDRLLPTMREFVERADMTFVATADGHGECDASLRAGPAGFVRVIDDRTLAYPEYRGNGVHASLGNMAENPHVGLLFVDFVDDLIGLHVNGNARIVDDAAFRAAHPELRVDSERGRAAERWVVVAVEEAYIHCRKHIPRMARVTQRRAWGTDDPGRKGGDYFGAKSQPTPARPVRRGRARRSFPGTAHLTGGVARVLRPRR